MADLSKNGKYLNLDGFRASYRKDDDTIHLTSTDPDFPQGFHLTLKDGSPTEKALRELLVENELIEREVVKPFPEATVWFKNADIDPYHFPLGVSMDGDVVWDTDIDAHMLLTGGSGSGKSVVLRNIIAHCAAHSDTWEMYGVDLTKVELYPYRENMVNIFNNAELTLIALRHISKVMMQRYADMSEQSVKNFRNLKDVPHAVMIVVDEMNALWGHTESENEVAEEIFAHLQNIARLGYSAGVHMVLVAQRFERKIIHPALSRNLTARILMGRSSSEQSYLTLNNGHGTKIDSSLRGRGLAQLNGEEILFQSYFRSLGSLTSE